VIGISDIDSHSVYTLRFVELRFTEKLCHVVFQNISNSTTEKWRWKISITVIIIIIIIIISSSSRSVIIIIIIINGWIYNIP
jgi:hypothetical protein